MSKADILNYLKENGPNSLRSIYEGLGLSKGCVSIAINKLEAEGDITFKYTTKKIESGTYNIKVWSIVDGSM